MSAHWCGEPDLHRHGLWPAASKAAASADFATAASLVGRAGVAPARVAPAAFEAAVSAVPPPTRMGPPAGSAPALRGYKPRALLLTPGRRRAGAGLRRDRAAPVRHRPLLSLPSMKPRMRWRWSSWPDSHRHPPRGGPGSQPGASTVSPQLVVPPAGSAPATSGVSCRRSSG
jgi:hypothetical protein